MKRWLLVGVMAIGIAVPALNSAASAGSTDDFGCSNATLKGEYAFGGTNYTLLLVFNGVRVYDGNGHFTQRDYVGDSVPAEFAPPGQETGTYTVNPDCTGSDELVGPTGDIKVLFVISNGGRHVHEVVSELTPPGSTTPVPTQTSVDVWKVDSEKND